MNFRAQSGRGGRTATVLDVTALVDVIFQLLIFFLLTSSYVSQVQPQKAAQVQVEVPESSLEAEAVKFEDLTLTIDAEGRIFVGEEETVSMEELAERLVRVANENTNTVVLIRGDQNVPYGRIAQVMVLARAAQLKISAVLRGD